MSDSQTAEANFSVATLAPLELCVQCMLYSRVAVWKKKHCDILYFWIFSFGFILFVLMLVIVSVTINFFSSLACLFIHSCLRAVVVAL